MLSSVLKSERAVQVNIQIIRAYIKMNRLLQDNREIWQKIEDVEKKLTKKDEEVKIIFNTLKQLLSKDTQRRSRIGFTISKQK
jgi:hypothetical protein